MKEKEIRLDYDRYRITISPIVIKSALKRYGLGEDDLEIHKEFLEGELETALKTIFVNGQKKLCVQSDNLNFTLEKTGDSLYRVIGARIIRK